MDSQSAAPDTHDPSAAIFQNSTIDKAQQSELFSVLQSSLACVTLGNNVLDESNHLLQDVKIPVLQALVTTPDGDYTTLSATISATLPRELVERILLLLDAESLLKCRLLNREFNETIQSSTVLQYYLACEAAGVIDNPQSPLSFVERLEALKKREDAWKKLKPVFEVTISVKHQTASQICRSTEGVYFLSDANRKDLNYFHLALLPQDNPQWIRIPGHGPAPNWSGILVNFVTALHEHDLIVNLISSEIENQTGEELEFYTLDLVFLKFSTGEYHPLARYPRIHVQKSSEVDPWVSSRISGDNIALVVHSDEGAFSDKLFIFDWKTGHKLLQHEATENGYLDLVFVSPELLLVPNGALSHFEVWHLSPHKLNPSPVQMLSLKIPAISPEYSLRDLDCYVDNATTNPSMHSMPYLPPQHFFSAPENSIIIFQVRMLTESDQLISYNFVVHRRALLDTIQTWTSPSLLEQQVQPMWLMNEVTVHPITDPEDGSVEFDVQSELVSTIPHLRSSPHDFRNFATPQASPTSHISSDSESSSLSSGFSTNSSTSRYTFLQLPWTKWGPPISRWFQVNTNQGRWFRSVGQRYAFSDPNPLDRSKLMVSVADFNPYNFRSVMVRLRSGEGEDDGSNGNGEGGKEKEEKEGFEILDHKGVFSEEVYMGLKCVVYRAPDEYDFDVVIMDEQRLLGLKLNHDGWIEHIKVLYIG